MSLVMSRAGTGSIAIMIAEGFLSRAIEVLSERDHAFLPFAEGAATRARTDSPSASTETRK